MASTNKTTNYDLPQFIGSDKPTWLGDFNEAMSTIDSQMKTNNDLASSSGTTATQALETAGTALSTAEGADTKATQNETNINKFNLTTRTNINESDITPSSGTIGTSTLALMSDATNSIFKLYGAISTAITTGGTYTFKFNSPLRPTENYTIDGTGIVVSPNNNIFRIITSVDTNGEITLQCYISGSNGNATLILFPCLYFNTNFGDTPTP